MRPLVQSVVHAQDALVATFGLRFTVCLLRSCTQKTGYMGYVRQATNLNFMLDPVDRSAVIGADLLSYCQCSYHHIIQSSTSVHVGDAHVTGYHTASAHICH